LCGELGDIAAAQQAYYHALLLHRTVMVSPQLDCCIVLQNLGELALRCGDHEAAWTYFTEELDLWKQLKDPAMLPHLAMCLHSLGEIMATAEAYAPARRNFEQALELRELTIGDDQPETADTLIQLGMVCRAQDDRAAARTYLTRAQQLYIQVLGSQHPMVAKLQTALTTLEIPN
jgi:tetratricopeptide (TPR) repeat protein